MTGRHSQPTRRVFDFPQGHNVSPARENTQKIQSCCAQDCEPVNSVWCLCHFTEEENHKIHNETCHYILFYIILQESSRSQWVWERRKMRVTRCWRKTPEKCKYMRRENRNRGTLAVVQHPLFSKKEKTLGFLKIIKKTVMLNHPKKSGLLTISMS